MRKRISISQAAAFVLVCASPLLYLPRAGAQNFFYEAVNQTLSAGDPVFSVSTNVTFMNMLLQETFADGASLDVPLKDMNGVIQTSLDTNTIVLDSDPFLLPDPTHGAWKSAILTGNFDTTAWTLQTAPGGPTQSVTVNPTFSTNLSGVGYTDQIYGVDASSGAHYAAGTISLLPPTPEPGMGTLLMAAGIGLTTVFRRRRSLQPRQRARKPTSITL